MWYDRLNGKKTYIIRCPNIVSKYNHLWFFLKAKEKTIIQKTWFGEVTFCIFYETHEIKGYFWYAMK
jgi:hypothetical protein